ncbi:MAG: DivIVA domain-containing protein [Ruoffia tabacinasalis]
MVDISKSLFGYNTSQVDSMMSQQTSKIDELEKKIESLESQLATYIELESALKEGIVDARQKGSQIIEDSAGQAEQIISKANEQATQLKEETINRGNDLLNGGNALRDRLTFMKDEMREMVDQVSEFIDGTDFESLFPKSEVDQYTMQISEFSDGKVEKRKESDEESVSESTLTDEEKRELEKLIHEVIANDAASKETQGPERNIEKKLIELRTLNG